MSVPVILPAVVEESGKNTYKKLRKPQDFSETESTTHSKKTSKTTQLSANKKNEAEARAAKERQEKLLRLYNLWSQVKQDERDEQHQYLKEKVSLQHSLISQQDQLYKKKQADVEKKWKQIKESRRLTRLARTKHYSNFVRNALAQDKMNNKPLQSYTSVISSHQPVCVPLLVGSESRSGETGDGWSHSRGSAEGTIGESILLADNFGELVNESVEVQLQALLGPDAEAFLKPTFREGAKKALDPLVHKHRGIGAHELWGILRGKSRKKLEREDEMIPADLKNAYRSFLRECVHADVPVFERSFCKDQDQIPEDQLSESHLIKDIHFALHRLDLMYRIAHMNKDKTRLLFKNMESADPSEGMVRPPRYNPKQIQAPWIRTLSLSDSESLSPRKEDPSDKEDKEDKPFALDGEKITFLTEKMAMCKGEFSKRHNAPGTLNKVTSRSLPAHPLHNIRGASSAPVSSRGKRNEKQGVVKTWQPLSLNALLDYRAQVSIVGSGKFRHGQQRKWKVD